MAKKIREIEVEYPDCTICGNEISGGEEYFDININLGKMTVGESGGGTGIRSGNNQRPLKLCKKCSKGLIPCALDEDPIRNINNMIMKELEKQMDELYSRE